MCDLCQKNVIDVQNVDIQNRQEKVSQTRYFLGTFSTYVAMFTLFWHRSHVVVLRCCSMTKR